jgi:Ni,Fe-hydrogenase III small subunit
MRRLILEGFLRSAATEGPPGRDAGFESELGAAVGAQARAKLGRSLSIRHVDAGSCNACELEIHALGNPYYDLERYGLRFTASPRHADVLLVTGPVTKNMQDALVATYDAIPAPKWVIANGDCARDGGCFARSAVVVGGVSKIIPVDIHVPGCPPAPRTILAALLALLRISSE